MRDYPSYLILIGRYHFESVRSVLDRIINHSPFHLSIRRDLIKPIEEKHSIVFLGYASKFENCRACLESQVCEVCGGKFPEGCEACHGTARVLTGTGGYAVIDGKKIPYTRYIRMKRRPNRLFWKIPHVINEVRSCRACGGRGRIYHYDIFAACHLSGHFEPVDSKLVARIGAGEKDSEIESIKSFLENRFGLSGSTVIGNTVVFDDWFLYRGKSFRHSLEWNPDFDKVTERKIKEKVLDGIA